MSAFFSSSSFYAQSSTRSRSRSRSLSSSRGQSLTRRASIRGKPVHVLPQVSEEEEMRTPVVEIINEDDMLSSAPKSGRARKPRPSGFNGSQSICIETVFETLEKAESSAAARRASVTKPTHELRVIIPDPSVSLASPPLSGPDVDDLSFRSSHFGVDLDFPRPPSVASTAYNSNFSPSSRLCSLPPMSCSPSCVRDTGAASPTFSTTSSSTATSTTLPTPGASDDDLHLETSPSKRPAALKLTLAKLDGSSDPDWTDSSDSEDEAMAWYRGEFSEVLTTLSPDFFPTPATPKTPHFAPARPDSFTYSSRRRSSSASTASTSSSMRRRSGALTPTSPRPSNQLDPQYPKRKRSMPRIPNRPPPPPPRIVCPPTTSRLQLLTPTTPNSALLSPYGFASSSSSGAPSPISPMCITPISPRPPPRTPVPAGIDDDEDEDDWTTWEINTSTSTYMSDGYEADVSFDIEVPLSPVSAVSSEASTTYSKFLSTPHFRRVSPSSTASFVDYNPESEMEPSEAAWRSMLEADEDEDDDWVPSTVLGMPIERQLRSRWSSSTLGAEAASVRPPSSLGARLRLKFGGEKKEKEKKEKYKSTSPTKTTSTASSGFLASPAKVAKQGVKEPMSIPRPTFSQLPPRPMSPCTPTRSNARSPTPLSFSSPSPSPSRSPSRACATPTSMESGSSGSGTILGGGLARRSSRSSHRTQGSDSGESMISSGSNGLRRKAIPVELFMRAK